MASRVGQYWLRRFSRAFASDLFLRATSNSDLLTTSQNATTAGRAWATVRQFDSGFPNSTIRISNFSHFRYLCSAPKDVDYSNRPLSVQDSGLDNVVTESEDVGEMHKPSKRHDLAMLFTCKVCETRSAKTMSRATYDTGIVIVRCPKCRNLHLIADRLGWFGEPGSVEDFLMQQGVSVKKGLEASYEFSVDDLTGWTPPSNSRKN